MESSDRHQHDQFLRLFVENEVGLRSFVRSLVPTLEDAREVMQETAAVLWANFDQLDCPENFRRWAFGVARMEALTFRRDQARDRHLFGDELIALLASDAAAIAEETDREERALEKCLAKLPKDKQLLIKAAYASETRIDEVARAASRTPMSIYKVLHRIRISLADCVRASLRREDGLA